MATEGRLAQQRREARKGRLAHRNFLARGEQLDLTDKLTAEGDLDWTAPGPDGGLSVVRDRGQPEVERAAPGGEGPCSIRFTARPWISTWPVLKAPLPTTRVRSPARCINDSYEYHARRGHPIYTSNSATPRLPA